MESFFIRKIPENMFQLPTCKIEALWLGYFQLPTAFRVLFVSVDRTFPLWKEFYQFK